MAKKKLVLDDAQLSRIAISNAANGKNIIPVAPAIKSGDSFSSSLYGGRNGRHIEEEVLDDEVTDVAATEQVTPVDNIVSDPEQAILLAKADVSLPPTPNTTPITVGQKGIDLFSSQTSNWWAGGVGLATVGTGVGFALSRDDSNNTNDPVSAISDSNVAANSVTENATTGTVVGITTLATDAGDTISYSLSDNAGGRFAIDATTGVITVADGTLLDYESTASHAVTVLATSSDGSTSSQQFSIDLSNVNDNPVSAISDSNVAADSVVENADTGTVVGITALATDADAGATISYSLSDNAGGRFAIDATTGVITVVDGTLLDFEIATSHDVTVLATSSDGSTNSQLFTINLSNSNDNPVSSIRDIDVAVADNAVVENAVTGTVVGITAQATDADIGTTISYSLSDNAGGRFAINAITGVITVADGTLLDFESATSHVVTVLATSSDGSINSQPFTVNLINVIEPVLAISDSNVAADNAVAENAVTGTVVGITALTADAGATISYSLSDNAGGRFAIDATTGVVTVADGTLLDFETVTSHDVTVLATNSDGSTNSQQFTINLSNDNDNPVSTISDSNGTANSVAENAVTGTVVGITALATDADGAATVSYSLSDNAGGRFAIDATTGVITVADGTLLDSESVTSHDVTVLATSTDGSTNSQQFTINLGNVNDNPVSAISDSNGTVNSVTENAVTGTVVGITALATDADAGATVSYSLSDNAGGRFAIDATTGVITVADGSLLDYESVTSHDVTVLATSSDGSTNSQQFTIGLTNVNEHFVVEASGAWIDLDADGVRDAEDTLRADFTPGSGNVDLTAISGVIHFNNVPDGDLNLDGFGADDRIEIDAQAFIDNGHHALNILSISGIKTLDEFRTTGGNLTYSSAPIFNSFSRVNNAHAMISNFVPSLSSFQQTGTYYSNSNSYSGVSGSILSANVSLNLRFNTFFTQRNLRFFSSSSSSGTNVQLASGLPTDIPLQDVVDFVNLPVQPATTHVVVDQDGAAIDIDGDGVRDNGENRLAVFADGGNADLSNKSVVVHFNEIPLNALDLSGFGSDDKIEFDVQAMRNNFILTSSATRLANISTANSTMVRYTFNSTSSLRLTVMQTPGTVTTFNSSVHSNAYALQISTMWTSVNGKWSGAFAYWTDTGNALNNQAQLLPDNFGTSPLSHTAVLGNLNANHYPGLIEFVWPVNVVADDQLGNVATFIDANANGVRDSGEDTLALLGQTQADVNAFNTVAGTSYGSQTVDLASEQVSIHYNDLPTGAWVPDMTGFNGNDRIEIDIAAMLNNITVNDTVTLNNQPTRTMGSQTQFYAGVSGVSSGNTAVYLSGGNLYFGHRVTSTSFTGSITVNNTHYTATGTLQGVIASNAGTIANNFEQVVFVTSIV